MLRQLLRELQRKLGKLWVRRARRLPARAAREYADDAPRSHD